MTIGNKKYWENKFGLLYVLCAALFFFGVSYGQGTPVEIIPQEKADRDSLVFVGYVEGKSLKTGMLRQQGYVDARNRLLKNAASLGAQFVVLDADQQPKYFVTSQIVTGKAYKAKSR